MADVIDKPGLVPRKEVMDEDTEQLNNLLEQVPDKEEEGLIEEEDTEIPARTEEEPEDELILEDDSNRGIDLKKVKEKYPDFAKTNEFRELRNAYHRETEYTNIFPTIDDAREAAENNETFQKLNHALVNESNPLA